MKKIILITLLILAIKANAQWTQIGYMIVNTTDSVSPPHIFKSFGTDVFCGTSKGLFKTTDNGNTWSNLTYNNTVTLNQNIYSVLKASNGNLFCGSSNRMFKSTDGGASWLWLSVLPDSATYLDIAEIGGNIVTSYTKGAGFGIYYSGNSGTTWTLATGITSISRFFLVDGTNLFVGGSVNGVFKSTDNGQTWNVSGTGLPASSGIWAVMRSGTKLFANSATGNGLFESSDNGATWTNTAASVFNGFCQVFSMCSSGNRIIVSNDGACNAGQISSIRTTTDAGATWSNLLTGISNPTYFPVLGRNTAGTSFFTKNGNGKEVYRYDLSTGISTIAEMETAISIYPNPFTAQTTITFNDTQKNTTIILRDLLGKAIKTMKVNGKQLILEKEELKAGIYFLQITDENQHIWIRKIVIQ
ncbi:MAG: T9SS type A sorting domain-containing protein [Bacteroidetes bacterium]|nr:T9SS type A sorting domain-containing protein [Bacteroidota bacterium]